MKTQLDQGETKLLVSETYVNLDKNCIYGESGWIDINREPSEIGGLFKVCQREFGRCTSKMYREYPDGDKQVGWVFVKRVEYDDPMCRRKPETYLREVWVEYRIVDVEQDRLSV